MCRYLILLGRPSLFILIVCLWHRDKEPLRQKHEMYLSQYIEDLT